VLILQTIAVFLSSCFLIAKYFSVTHLSDSLCFFREALEGVRRVLERLNEDTRIQNLCLNVVLIGIANRDAEIVKQHVILLRYLVMYAPEDSKYV
jgi:hypothetical protein